MPGDLKPDDRLMIDFDDTDARLRIWEGATLVGELRPNQNEAPPDDAGIATARWTGWLNSYAVAELFGSYTAETKRQAVADV